MRKCRLQKKALNHAMKRQAKIHKDRMKSLRNRGAQSSSANRVGEILNKIVQRKTN